MTPAELAARLAELPGNELAYHGFTGDMRDYELIVMPPADPNSGRRDAYVRFIFRICPEVSIRSRVAPEVWSRSIDDALVSQHHVTRQSEGHDWGVRCQVPYPGAAVVGDSERARWWAGQVGVEFHEVEISAKAHQIILVFANLQVEAAPDGYTPFAAW